VFEQAAHLHGLPGMSHEGSEPAQHCAFKWSAKLVMILDDMKAQSSHSSSSASAAVSRAASGSSDSWRDAAIGELLSKVVEILVRVKFPRKFSTASLSVWRAASNRPDLRREEAP
jgi:hypothetical protein